MSLELLRKKYYLDEAPGNVVQWRKRRRIAKHHFM
jgi:hypothetical protein